MMSSIVLLSFTLAIGSLQREQADASIEVIKPQLQEALRNGDFDLALQLVDPLRYSEESDARLVVADVYFMRAELGSGSQRNRKCDIARAFTITLSEARAGSTVAASTLFSAYSFGDYGLPRDEEAAACWGARRQSAIAIDCPVPGLQDVLDFTCDG